MTITFQLQMELYDGKNTFSELNKLMREFKEKLEKNGYTRAQMYINEKAYEEEE